jgi:hypothetical protein
MNAPPNFNRLAGIYRWLEWASFGPWLGLCRCAFLDETRSCRRAIVLGDGDGRFTGQLLRGNPSIHVDAVDASDAMLRSLLRAAGEHSGRVAIHVADVRNWQARPEDKDGDGYTEIDLISTHFLLDCLTTDEIRSLATMLRKVVSPSAIWLVSEFAVPGNLFGRLVAGPVVFVRYRAFAMLTGLKVRRLPDHTAALGESGFEMRKQRRWMGGLLASEVWAPSMARNGVDSIPKSF